MAGVSVVWLLAIDGLSDRQTGKGYRKLADSVGLGRKPNENR